MSNIRLWAAGQGLPACFCLTPFLEPFLDLELCLWVKWTEHERFTISEHMSFAKSINFSWKSTMGSTSIKIRPAATIKQTHTPEFSDINKLPLKWYLYYYLYLLFLWLWVRKTYTFLAVKSAFAVVARLRWGSLQTMIKGAVPESEWPSLILLWCMRDFEVCWRKTDMLVERKDRGLNGITACLLAHQMSLKKATGSLSYLLSWWAICPKEVEQLDSCNKLIAYRWNSIKSVRCVKPAVPTGVQAHNRCTDR